MHTYLGLSMKINGRAHEKGVKGVTCPQAQGQKGGPKARLQEFPGLLHFFVLPRLATHAGCWKEKEVLVHTGHSVSVNTIISVIIVF